MSSAIPSQKNSKKKFEWKKGLCKECDICIKMCPKCGLKFENGELVRDEKKCNFCRICERYCPDSSIKIHEL